MLVVIEELLPLAQLKPIMSKLYFFKSDNDSDKCSCVTVYTSSPKRAYGLALINFIKNGYKGSPVRLAI